MKGTIMQNGASIACYGQGVNVQAGARVTVCEFEAPASHVMYGLSVGFGLSDVTAWGAGAGFIINIDGMDIVTFTDQISDLLRPEFLPVEIRAKQLVRIECLNSTAVAVVAAVFARIEAI